MTSERHRHQDLRLEEASAWLVRLQSGDEADALAFDAWLSASEENARAYDSVVGLWSEYEAAAPEVLDGLVAEDRRRSRRLERGRGWTLAAGLAAAATVAVAVLPGVLDQPRTQAYATATGERRTLRLEDGSTLDLNAASRLTVTYARGERRVDLHEGEAIFDVAHDHDRPFVISAGDRQVRVVGTQFDVRRRGEELSVTVARGVVEVRPVGGGAGQAVRLQAGQRLEHVAGGGEKVSTASPEEALAWRSGRLIYRDTPLTEVVEDLNLHFARPIRLDDPSLGQIRVSGVLVLDNQDAVIRRLSLLAPLSAVTLDGGVVLRRAKATKP